jgi:ABC-2 type transport system permease protein
MSTLLHLTSANLKSFTRDRAAMFWTLAFPLVFILLFGAIFSGGGVSRFTVAWVDTDGSPASTALQSNPALANVFTLNTYATSDDAIAAMKQGDVRAVIVVPKGFGSAITSGGAGGGAALPLTVYTDPSNQQVSATITGIVASLVGGFNQAASGRPPILALKTQTVQSEAITAVAYLVPSILAMALMQLGLFSAIPIVEQRESLILKRIAATPIKRRTFIAANVITRLLIGLIQAVVILIVAQVVFGITMLGNPLVFAGIVVLGALAFIALGYVVASFAPTEDSASQMVSILQFPLMFLSGIFFALESLPSFLRGVAAFMPLTYLGDALRQVMVGGTPFVPLGVGVGILAAWLVGCFLISARYFRWQ